MKSKYFMVPVMALLCVSFGSTASGGGTAIFKFAKCEFQVKVEGVGLGNARVPVRITSWARQHTQFRANRAASNRAQRCLKEALLKNLSSIPGKCQNSSSVHNRFSHSSAVASFKTTNGFNILKKLLCQKLKTKPRTNKKVQTANDFKRRNTHKINGFRVYLKRVRSLSSGAKCPNRNLYGPGVITMHCHQRGSDSGTHWYHR